MSLRRALASLPDDRATVATAREVVAFFDAHPHEALEPERVSRATGMEHDRTDPVLKALSDAFVIDCDGDPRLMPSSYDPDTVLALEVRRFLRVKDSTTSRLQHSVDRYRGRFGSL